MIAAVTLLADSGFDSHMGDWGAGWWILMAAMMVVFWGLVILGIVWVIRSLGPGRPHQHAATALDLLDQRLASGEITPKEYRERRDLLTRGS
jgi:putative membrane protein